MNLTRILAVSTQAMRAAVRSRFILSLIVLLAVVMVGLPLVLKGDGSPEGQVRVLLEYTLDIGTAILILATLWASCCSISREVEEKTIRLVVVKPVHRYEIWIGKWLGLVLVNAVLLILSGCAIFGLTCWTLRPARTSEAQRAVIRDTILAGRRLVLPRVESIDATVALRYKQFISEHGGAKDVDTRKALTDIRKTVLGERLTVAPGGAKSWTVTLPLERAGREQVTLRFRLSTLVWNRLSISGQWEIATTSGTTLCRMDVGECLGGVYHVPLPRSFSRELLRAHGESEGSVPLVITFHNGERGRSHTALFDSAGPVELLVHESGFLSNLARALLVILLQTAIVAAVGLTASSLFSSPVAVFAGVVFVTMVIVGQYFALVSSPEQVVEEHHHGQERVEPGLLVRTGQHIGSVLHRLSAPAMQFHPIDRLADGILIPWSRVGCAVVWLACVYPGALLAISGLVLKRRELAPRG